MAGQCLITKIYILTNKNSCRGVPGRCSLESELILKYWQNPEEIYICEGACFVKIETSFLLKINSFTQTFARFGWDLSLTLWKVVTKVRNIYFTDETLMTLPLKQVKYLKTENK